MLETLFELPFALRRHREAPLLKEREEFLSRLYRQGTSRGALVTFASLLIHVNRLLGLKTLRDVELAEIRAAAAKWAKRRPSHPSRKTGPCSATYFSYCAKKATASLRDSLVPEFLTIATFVPVPPSKSIGHPEYDDRMTQVLRSMGNDIDVSPMQSSSWTCGSPGVGLNLGAVYSSTIRKRRTYPVPSGSVSVGGKVLDGSEAGSARERYGNCFFKGAARKFLKKAKAAMRPEGGYVALNLTREGGRHMVFAQRQS